MGDNRCGSKCSELVVWDKKGRFTQENGPDAGSRGLRDYLAECERWYVCQALGRCEGKIGEAARFLGISRKNLWERMNRLGIERGIPESGLDWRGSDR